jgi:hypothetical protein
MRANLIVCLLAFSGCLKALDLKGGISSQERLSPENEVPAGDEVMGPDAYKLGVLILVGASILSVCL